ncbi:MAG: hypothetical protein H0U09_16125 [Geodermatophilaceae bacterium]|nr:hypothetical protein [Geodermatophilaceae bacterium]
MNTTEDLRKAMRGEPLPADRVDPVALLRLGRRRRRLRRLGVAAASSLTAAGVALAAQLGLPPGVGPAGPAGEPTATDAPVNQAPALEPDGPVPNTYSNAVSLLYVECMQVSGHDLSIVFPGEFVDEQGEPVVELKVPDETDRGPRYQDDDGRCLAYAEAEASASRPTG